MSDTKVQSIRIKGHSILQGSVYLSGDPLSSIFYICIALSDEKFARIKNVPRCKLLLDFIFAIENLGVLVNWEDETTITVDGKQEIRDNLVGLYNGNDYSFAEVLIPVLLKRNRECDVHPNLRSEVKFFRELGVLVKSNYNILNLKLPLDINYDVKKNFDLIHANPYMVASRLLTSRIFKNLSIDYDKNDSIFLFHEARDFDDDDNVLEFVASYNQGEFNFYASIAGFSNGEISLHNYNLSESLDFLLSMDEIGFRYEVSSQNIKIWYAGSDIESILEWSGHSFSSLSPLILLLAKTTKKTVKLICTSFPALEDLITDLNIMGCRIESEAGKKGYSLITVKPPSAFSSVKNDISDLNVGLAVLAFSCCYSGNSRISGFEIISEYMPYLIDNLKSLNVDISNR